MSERTSTSYDASLIRPAELARSALKAKLNAIAGYDTILWKIRAGYLAVLYGSLGLILGTAGSPDLRAMAANTPLAVAAISLIFSFSLTAFLVDFGYLRKKLRNAGMHSSEAVGGAADMPSTGRAVAPTRMTRNRRAGSHPRWASPRLARRCVSNDHVTAVA
jgi:hypothetical protein